jgi:hypothetical protein
MESTNPFYFGRMVAGNSFTDREDDMQRLAANFTNCLNTVLMSPRRWGKSSLVQRVSEYVTGAKIKVAYIDAFSLRTELDFYNAYAKAVLTASSSRWEDWLSAIKNIFKQIVPKITIGIDPTTDFSIGFDWNEIQKNTCEILDLPNKIAKASGFKMVVCIDEFQNIATFSDALAFQKQLRSVWQKHDAACYCLYGSKFHMMQELFERQSMPFYRFGDLVHLGKIPAPKWSLFIKNQFANTDKKISDSIVKQIVKVVDRHSYYVQQLSYLIWQRTINVVNAKIYREAVEDMINQNAILYQRDTENMSETQLNFLKAIASGQRVHLSSADVLRQYKLGTSANVVKIKKHLLDSEIIDIKNKEVAFIDPVYELWFKREILKIKVSIK